MAPIRTGGGPRPSGWTIARGCPTLLHIQQGAPPGLDAPGLDRDLGLPGPDLPSEGPADLSSWFAGFPFQCQDRLARLGPAGLAECSGGFPDPLPASGRG